MSNSKLIFPSESPLDIAIDSSIKKANHPIRKLILLGLLAGSLIALAAAASTMASMNLLANPDTYGLGRLVAALVFVGGLACVILAGAELFTGNVTMLSGLLSKKITSDGLLRNWLIVIIFNFIGGALIALLISATGIFGSTPLYGAMTIKIATCKTAMDFLPALISGLLCNFLVCLAVWIATTARTAGAKIAAIFFPVLIFVTMGFEHSIANSFYIPAGLLAQTDPSAVSLAKDLGTDLSTLNPAGLFQNFTPVILGNILGGATLIIIYHLASKSPKSTPKH